HLGYCLGYLARFGGVQLGRTPGVDLAEVTPAGALLPTDEERRLAVLPALVNVRAAGLLAHRVQRTPAGQRLQLLELWAGPHLRPDPRGFPLDRRLGVAYLQPQHLASLWGNSHAVISCVLRDTRTPAGSGAPDRSRALPTLRWSCGRYPHLVGAVSAVEPVCAHHNQPCHAGIPHERWVPCRNGTSRRSRHLRGQRVLLG